MFISNFFILVFQYLNFPKLSKKHIKSRLIFIRALFYVRLGQTHFEPISQKNTDEKTNNKIKEEENANAINSKL